MGAKNRKLGKWGIKNPMDPEEDNEENNEEEED